MEIIIANRGSTGSPYATYWILRVANREYLREYQRKSRSVNLMEHLINSYKKVYESNRVWGKKV